MICKVHFNDNLLAEVKILKLRVHLRKLNEEMVESFLFLLTIIRKRKIVVILLVKTVFVHIW